MTSPGFFVGKTVKMISDLVFIGLALLVNTIMFTWIYDLEKCKCAHSWKRDALKYSIPVTVALGVLAVLVRSREWKLVAYTVYDIVSSFVLITILSYVVDLRQLTCECSKGWRETFSFVWPLTVASMWVLNVLFVLGIMVYMAITAKDEGVVRVYVAA
jgi:hypothetical protein